MMAHRVETILTEDRKLTLDDLPFRAGDVVEVIIRERGAPGDEADNAAESVADWLAASKPSLQEVWDNDKDAVYDHV